jgi:hypothetical protein
MELMKLMREKLATKADEAREERIAQLMARAWWERCVRYTEAAPPSESTDSDHLSWRPRR